MRDNPVVPAVPGESEEQARPVKCPYCGASGDQPCYSPDGADHPSRSRAIAASRVTEPPVTAGREQDARETLHRRANDAYCTCGRRFYSDIEQARHEQWDNLTDLQQARALAALLPSPPATTAETNGHEPLVPAEPLTLDNLDRRILNVVDPRNPGAQVRMECVGLVRAARTAAALPSPPATTGAGEREALIAAVRHLHRQDPDSHGWCMEDGFTWPCATITALTPDLASPPATDGDAATRPKAHCTQHAEHNPACPWCRTAERDLARATRDYTLPPATDGDAAGECPTCGGIHRHGGDCHGEGKAAHDTETETRPTISQTGPPAAPDPLTST